MEAMETRYEKKNQLC